MAARLAFFGTPEFAVPSLRACIDVGSVVAVGPSPTGRGAAGSTSSPPR